MARRDAALCFDLLRLSRRGAMSTCGERLGSVGMGVGGCGSGRRVGSGRCPARVLCSTRRCFHLL